MCPLCRDNSNERNWMVHFFAAEREQRVEEMGRQRSLFFSPSSANLLACCGRCSSASGKANLILRECRRDACLNAAAQDDCTPHPTFISIRTSIIIITGHECDIILLRNEWDEWTIAVRVFANLSLWGHAICGHIFHRPVVVGLTHILYSIHTQTSN